MSRPVYKKQYYNNTPYIRQGDIWWVEIEEKGKGHEQHGRRPFYVISKTFYNKNSKTPVGFFISTSTKKAGNRFTIDLPYKLYKSDNQEKYVTVNVSQVRPLAIERFKKKFGYTETKYVQNVLELFNNTLIF